MNDLVRLFQITCQFVLSTTILTNLHMKYQADNDDDSLDDGARHDKELDRVKVKSSYRRKTKFRLHFDHLRNKDESELKKKIVLREKK